MFIYIYKRGSLFLSESSKQPAAGKADHCQWQAADKVHQQHTWFWSLPLRHPARQTLPVPDTTPKFRQVCFCTGTWRSRTKAAAGENHAIKKGGGRSHPPTSPMKTLWFVNPSIHHFILAGRVHWDLAATQSTWALKRGHKVTSQPHFQSCSLHTAKHSRGHHESNMGWWGIRGRDCFATCRHVEHFPGKAVFATVSLICCRRTTRSWPWTTEAPWRGDRRLQWPKISIRSWMRQDSDHSSTANTERVPWGVWLWQRLHTLGHREDTQWV